MDDIPWDSEQFEWLLEKQPPISGSMTAFHSRRQRPFFDSNIRARSSIQDTQKMTTRIDGSYEVNPSLVVRW
jgi:hypothetical protein